MADVNVEQSNVETQVDTEAANRDKLVEENCVIEGNFDLITRSFDDLNLKRDLLRGIYSHGFTRPSPIQSRAIAPCIQGRDVLAQAQSGTGKTATFVISSLQRIDTENPGACLTQVLVLAPTRELASQIKQVYSDIAQYMNIKVYDVIGGVSVKQNIDYLKNEGAHVLVGTPGRVIHLINAGSLITKNIKVFILDEADTMLDRGFLQEIYQIFRAMPSDVQVILLSATMPDDIKAVSEKFMRDPVSLSVRVEQLSLQVIRQFYVVTQDRNNKVDAILDIMSESNLPHMVIFVNSQRDATVLCTALRENNFEVEYLHAGLDQAERTKTMSKFRMFESKVLVATDVLARGIDVQTVALVINFDLPKDPQTYLHRIGRSGRYGRKGMAINLVLAEEVEQMKKIQDFYKTSITELPSDFRSYL